MPQITVEYSAALEEGFERQAFARALHAGAAGLIGGDPDNFKSRFYRLDEVVIGDGAPAKAMFHVGFALLPGRSEDLKRELGELVLALATNHLKVSDELIVQVTVEVRDLVGYQKRVLGVRAEPEAPRP